MSTLAAGIRGRVASASPEPSYGRMSLPHGVRPKPPGMPPHLDPRTEPKPPTSEALAREEMRRVFVPHLRGWLACFGGYVDGRQACAFLVGLACRLTSSAGLGAFLVVGRPLMRPAGDQDEPDVMADSGLSVARTWRTSGAGTAGFRCTRW